MEMCREAPTYVTVHCDTGNYPEGKPTNLKVYHFELPILLNPEIIRN